MAGNMVNIRTKAIVLYAVYVTFKSEKKHVYDGSESQTHKGRHSYCLYALLFFHAMSTNREDIFLRKTKSGLTP